MNNTSLIAVATISAQYPICLSSLLKIKREIQSFKDRGVMQIGRAGSDHLTDDGNMLLIKCAAERDYLLVHTDNKILIIPSLNQNVR